MKRFLQTIIIMCAAAFGAPAQSVTVATELDSTVVLMGSKLNMTVTVSMPESDAATAQVLNLPEIQNPQLGFGVYYGVDVVDSVLTDTVVENGLRKLTYNYTLQAFDPGLVDLPPVMVLPRAGADTVKSNFLTLKVLPVEVDTVSMEPMPMAGPVAADMRWHDYIPLWVFWVLGALVVAAAAIILFVKLRKHKEIIAMEAAKPVPPYELAVSRLEKLRASGIAAMGHEKEFYTELTDILRQYLHGRFGINAMEMTSSQIVKALRNNPETRIPSERVDDVLRIADFVKFAKERPLADDNQRAMLRAREFVETTKPQPLPEPGTPGQGTPGHGTPGAAAPGRPGAARPLDPTQGRKPQPLK